MQVLHLTMKGFRMNEVRKPWKCNCSTKLPSKFTHWMVNTFPWACSASEMVTKGNLTRGWFLAKVSRGVRVTQILLNVYLCTGASCVCIVSRPSVPNNHMLESCWSLPPFSPCSVLHHFYLSSNRSEASCSSLSRVLIYSFAREYLARKTTQSGFLLFPL